jgi:hypothetical protein
VNICNPSLCWCGCVLLNTFIHIVHSFTIVFIHNVYAPSSLCFSLLPHDTLFTKLSSHSQPNVTNPPTTILLSPSSQIYSQPQLTNPTTIETSFSLLTDLSSIPNINSQDFPSPSHKSNIPLSIFTKFYLFPTLKIDPFSFPLIDRFRE